MGRFILNWSQFCIILLAVLQEQFGRLTVPLSVCGSFRALKEGTFFCLGMTRPWRKATALEDLSLSSILYNYEQTILYRSINHVLQLDRYGRESE